MALNELKNILLWIKASGKSYYLVITQNIARVLGIKRGDILEIYFENHGLALIDIVKSAKDIRILIPRHYVEYLRIRRGAIVQVTVRVLERVSK